LEIPAYIIINLLLFSSWYALLFSKRGQMRFADRLLGAFVLGLAQMVATEMLLGVLIRKLYPAPLFILNVLISAGVFVIALRKREKGVLDEIRDEAARTSRIVRGDLALSCLTILFVLSVLWQVLLGWLFPSYSWDALYYHLPIVGQIMQSGAIGESPVPSFIQQYINIFPKNINLFFLWNVIFLKSDVIVDLGQLFFALAGVISIYSMAVKLQIKEKYALYSSLLFFFAPVVVLQSTANYVDCAVSVLFIISLNFLMYDVREGSTDDNAAAFSGNRKVPVLLSGLAAGILLGSKPTGPLFIAVMAAVIAGREAVRHFRRSAAYSSGNGLRSYLLWFMTPVLLAGGYWYFRNWLLYGNPVYYMDVSVFNVTLLKGLKSDWVEPAPEIIDKLTYTGRLLHVWLERTGYYMYDSRLSGFGPLWFILFLPAVLFSLVYAVMRKRYDFLFISMMLIVTFIVHPRNWTTRYVIFIVAQGALSFGLVLDWFERRGKALMLIALMLAGYTFLTANSPCVMPEKIREFILLPANERTLTRHKPFNIDIKVRNEYGYWMWIENNISGGDTLAYTFESMTLDTSMPFFTAPLWNRGFSNRVAYVKADTYRKWLDRLEGTGATYILCKKGSLEDRWIEKERSVYYSLRWMGNIAEKFKVVYSDENYMIVMFMKAEG